MPDCFLLIKAPERREFFCAEKVLYAFFQIVSVAVGDSVTVKYPFVLEDIVLSVCSGVLEHPFKQAFVDGFQFFR